jgi:hypothetical protein
VGYFGAESFPQVLISNGLEIICKDLGNIYTPGGYRGGTQFSVVSGQWSVTARSGGDRTGGGWTYGHYALTDRNYLQNLAAARPTGMKRAYW